MRLRLVTTDRPPFWLVGDPAKNERTDQSAALTQTVQITRNQQVVTGAEWESKLHYDRQNGSVTIDANTRYEFASEIERMDFIAELAALEAANQKHEWGGDIWLRHVVAADSTFKEWHLPDAVVSLTGTQLVGAVGLMLTYRVQAGGFDGETIEGTEGVSLTAVGSYADSVQLLLFLTTVGGSWSDAAVTLTGLPPTAISAGNVFQISIGDAGDTTAIDFEAVDPGDPPTTGRRAVETPIIDNLQTIADAFADVEGARVYVTTHGGRPCLYVGWVAAPIGAPEDVIAYFQLGIPGYQIQSDASNTATTLQDTMSLIDSADLLLLSDETN